MIYKNYLLAILSCAGIQSMLTMQREIPVYQMPLSQKLKTNHRAKLADGTYKYSTRDREAILSSKSNIQTIREIATICVPAGVLIKKAFFSKTPLSRKAKIATWTLLLGGVIYDAVSENFSREYFNLKEITRLKNNNPGDSLFVITSVTNATVAAPLNLEAAKKLLRDLATYSPSLARNNPDHLLDPICCKTFYYPKDITDRLLALVQQYMQNDQYKALKKIDTKSIEEQVILWNNISKTPVTGTEFTQVMLRFYHELHVACNALDPRDKDSVKHAQGLGRCIHQFRTTLPSLAECYTFSNKRNQLFTQPLE